MDDIEKMLARISERLDSQDFVISAYLKHQRDGPGFRMIKWVIGLVIKGVFGYAMTLWIPKILGWK